MTIKCTVCKLEPARRDAVNAALGANISLEEVSRRSGISKSSLHRHAQHLPGREVAVGSAAALPPPREAAPLVPAPPAPPAPPPAPVAKGQLLGRIELLWAESLSGLAAAKESICLSKPDGSKVEIAGGDLRARASFIREARSVAELSGVLSGELNANSGGERSSMTFVLMPLMLPGAPAAAEVRQIEAVDVAFEPLPEPGSSRCP